jgi:RNA polymerase sigma-70 factor, ECF subfamily
MLTIFLAQKECSLKKPQMKGESPSAVHLIRQVAKQDRNAFSQLYDRCSSLVFSLALRMLKARSDAEDLLQEVFVQIWRQAANYSEERGSPEAWIINITRSRAIDKLRSIRRMERSFILTEDPARAESSENVESLAAESEARLTMNSALANLPEAQRKVLELAYFDGLTQTEIATRLAEPLGTVKTRMRSGIQRLKEMMRTQAS